MERRGFLCEVRFESLSECEILIFHERSVFALILFLLLSQGQAKPPRESSGISQSFCIQCRLIRRIRGEEVLKTSYYANSLGHPETWNLKPFHVIINLLRGKEWFLYIMLAKLMSRVLT
jgi:hypothetical protein